MTASVIVPVFNRKGIITPCLRALLAQEMDDYEVIVIDDGSTDGTTDILKTFPPDSRLSILHNRKNSGPAHARNRGIEASRGAFLAFIDSDCIADPSWLKEILRPLQHDPGVMITAGQTMPIDGTSYWSFVNKGENFIRKGSGFAQRAMGCNMAFRREFSRHHMFDERIAEAGGEDTDICLSCIKDNGKIFYTEDARVRHEHRSQLQSTLAQQFTYGFNNAYVYRKHSLFPYISYGAWILFAAFLMSAMAFIFSSPALLQISGGLLSVYLGIALFFTIRPGHRRPWEILAAYPGVLLCCLANTAGNLSYGCLTILQIKRNK